LVARRRIATIQADAGRQACRLTGFCAQMEPLGTTVMPLYRLPTSPALGAESVTKLLVTFSLNPFGPPQRRDVEPSKRRAFLWKQASSRAPPALHNR
jgi:hypothetical protein